MFPVSRSVVCNIIMDIYEVNVMTSSQRVLYNSCKLANKMKQYADLRRDWLILDHVTSR